MGGEHPARASWRDRSMTTTDPSSQAKSYRRRPLVAAVLTATVLAGACSGGGEDSSTALAGGGQHTPRPAVLAPATETAIVPPPPAWGGPPPAPLPPPVARPPRSSTAGGTWAVAIGINDYPGNGHDLRAAVADAETLDQALSEMGVGADRRLVLRDAEASGAAMARAADWLVARAGPEAVAVFFFAGHVRKLGPGREGLVGADGGILSDEALAARLSTLAARRVWVAVAACYGAGFDELAGPGRVLTGAAAANALAYESTTLGRSYLVEYMVKRAMIEQRAPTSVQAAFAYARQAVAREHPGRVPVQLDWGGGELDLRPPGAVSPPPPPAGSPARPEPPAGEQPAETPAPLAAPPPVPSTTPKTCVVVPPLHPSCTP